MIDVYELSDMKRIWLLRGLGSANAEEPGTLSPDPWHFSLFASSMVQEQGDATALSASPMPLDCCGARGACQQSPILRSSDSRLSTATVFSKGHTERLLFFYHAIGPKRKMPGVWGQSPQEPMSMENGPTSAAGTTVTWESPFGGVFS